MRKFIVFVLIIQVLGCVEELEVNVPNASGKLVVDGMISNQSGPYIVRLSRSRNYFELNEQNEIYDEASDMVGNAEVYVEDGLGNRLDFTESNTGVYKSLLSGMKGTIGQSYKLYIKLEDGSRYESTRELMKPNVGIKEFEREETSKKILNELNNEISIDGIQVTILPNEFSGIDDFYRWRWQGTYEIETFPQLRQKLVRPRFDQVHDAPADSLELVPFPPECSGYIVVFADPVAMGVPADPLLIIEQVGPCECCSCWINETTDLSLTSKTTIGASKVVFDFFEHDNPLFANKYYIKLQQISLSREAHEFWKIIELQQNSGSLFSTSNTEIPSNIRSVDNENEEVLGFFSASSISEVSFYLDDSKIFDEPIVLYDTVKGDCRLLKNSTDQEPLFW